MQRTLKNPTMSAIVRMCLAAAVAALIAIQPGCTPVTPVRDADVIVVGAGIAGLAAALEASAAGARVIVIEANSVGGGHAVKAGGFALVNTALQRAKGINDSPDLALQDLYRWGEDPDPHWARKYVDESSTQVYDWLTNLGVQFNNIIDTPEDSVPRFHFTRGTAVNVIVPMLRKALQDPNIRFVWNTRVTEFVKINGSIKGVLSANERTGFKAEWRAPATILTTGGFESNLAMVRENWPAGQTLPKPLYSGAGYFATGDGYRLVQFAGGKLRNMDRQEIFYSGIPDPRAPDGERALYAENPAAVWLGANGRRFINENADNRTLAEAIDQMKPMNYWLLFDKRGSRRLNIRDVSVQEAALLREDILANSKITASGWTIDELAIKAGLPAYTLRTTVEAWNRMVELGEDYQFGRFDKTNRTATIGFISEPPYYALRVYPLTRKSMGGPVININAQVMDTRDLAIPGLYAAGELTGVAGINGKHGGSGTFLGPSVLTGRVAGKAAAEAAKTQATIGATGYAERKLPGEEIILDRAAGQAGYWHYDAVHRSAAARNLGCDRCHSGNITSQTTDKPEVMLTRLATCTNCH